MKYFITGGILGIAIGFLFLCVLLHFGKRKRRKKIKIHVMDVILVFIAVYLAWFTAELIQIYRETGGIPDTLCVSVFGICGGECGAMAMIQNTKTKRQDRKNELEDRKYQEKREQMLKEG